MRIELWIEVLDQFCAEGIVAPTSELATEENTLNTEVVLLSHSAGEHWVTTCEWTPRNAHTSFKVHNRLKTPAVLEFHLYAV